ncbi:MAG: segregation/condensation protein A [Candidatus Micrarchaeota archaeon]|nr:segregation/condensation protein A [Candidatus Micrarchaeota archaeon]
MAPGAVGEALDLERMVAQPTWRELLVDMVVSEDFDPWNLDIVQISDKYLEHIRGMQINDLHIPANLILAASILLRFKSDALHFEEEEQVVQDEVYLGEAGEAPSEIPMLSLRTRIPPKRKVSLGELISSLNDVFESIKKRASSARHEPIQMMSIEIPRETIEEKMNELFSMVKKLSDKEGMVTFSSLLPKKTAEAKIGVLMPLLHLAQERKVWIAQEKMFGEIFVQIADDAHGRKSKTNN